MKVKDIFEMTRRLGVSVEPPNFPDYSKLPIKLEGKMEHGYEVYSYPYNGTVCYVVKVGEQFASMTQLKPIVLPVIGKVFESDNSITKPEFAGHLLSYKLRYFLINHLGLSLILGNIHTLATERVLPKIAHLFEVKMINIKTGEMVDWSPEAYQQLTHKFHVTDWQVLLLGTTSPYVNEDCHSLDWSGDIGRHKWAYCEYFNDIDKNLEEI